MFIEYNNEKIAQDILELKDIEKTAIEAVNDDGLYFYFVLITVRGVAHITTCGPIIPDLTELPNGYTCDYTQTKFDRKKIFKIISTWLNSAKPGKSKPITSAKIICIEDALTQFKSPSAYYFNDAELTARMFNDFEGEILEDD